MNATDQRRLTPLLIGVCIVAAGLLALVVSGAGTAVHWGPGGGNGPGLPSASASVASAHVPDLQSYSAVWERPLFNADRRPSAEQGNDHGGQVSLGDLELTGIILTPGLHMALMHDRRSGEDVRVREGARLPSGGWTLQSLHAHKAVFVGQGRRVELTLKVAGSGSGSDDGTSSPAADSSTAAQHPPQKQKPPPRTSPAAARRIEQARRARLRALKARIEERRRALEARKNGGS